MSTVPAYPVRVEGRLDPKLSRWLWLVKWLLAIPHYFVLAFVWIAFVVLTVFAFFAILFTGRYPRSMFEFNVGVLRWTWRVAYYSHSALATDRYPPFSLDEEPDYPATLTISYPGELSRGLALVKWWLLAIPHYLVVAFFVGGMGFLLWRWPWGSGLIGLLALIAALTLLFTGRYPRGIFDLVLGLNRWVLRVAAYAGLMTDRYPPFRLDLGGREPGEIAVEVSAPASPATGVAASKHGWGARRVLAIVAGSLFVLVSLGLLAGGGAGVVFDQTQRDSAGFVMTPTKTFTTKTHALVSDRYQGGWLHDWWARSFIGTVQIRSSSESSVFVGIGPAEAVDRYLGSTRYERVTDLGATNRSHWRLHPGAAVPKPPETQTFWVAATAGDGTRTLTWKPKSGDWRVVVMNVTGSNGVVTDLSVGAKLPHLLWIGIGLLGAGAIVLGAGTFLLVRRTRR